MLRKVWILLFVLNLFAPICFASHEICDKIKISKLYKLKAQSDWELSPKLVYNDKNQNLSINIKISELILKFYEIPNENFTTDLGILILSSQNNEFGQWLWSNGASHGDLLEEINPKIEKAPNYQKFCENDPEIKSDGKFKSIFIPSTYIIEFTPAKFWNYFDGFGKTRLIFTPFVSNLREILKLELNLWENFEILGDFVNFRVDWTDCSGGQILYEPKVKDFCGVCGGKNRTCDCQKQGSNSSNSCSVPVKNSSLSALSDPTSNQLASKSTFKSQVDGNASVSNKDQGRDFFTKNLKVNQDSNQLRSSQSPYENLLAKCTKLKEDGNGQSSHRDRELDTEIKKRVKILGQSNVVNIGDMTLDPQFKAKSNFTVTFQPKKKPANQFETVKMWDSVRDVEKKLNAKIPKIGENSKLAKQSKSGERITPRSIVMDIIDPEELNPNIEYKTRFYYQDSTGAVSFSEITFELTIGAEEPEEPDPEPEKQPVFSLEIVAPSEHSSENELFVECLVLECPKTLTIDEIAKSITLTRKKWKFMWVVPSLGKVEPLQIGNKLRIPKNSLDPWINHTIKVDVTDQDENKITLNDSIVIHVISQGIVVFVPVTKLSIYTNQSFTLDASKSHKMGSKEGLQFEWQCILEGERIESVLEKELLSSPLLEIPESIIFRPGMYTWTIVVHNGNENDRRSKSILVEIKESLAENSEDVIEMALPQVSISKLFDRSGEIQSYSVDGSQGLRILATINADEESIVKWLIRSEAGERTTSSPYNRIDGNQDTIEWKYDQLKFGYKYIIRVTVSTELLVNSVQKAAETWAEIEINVRGAIPHNRGVSTTFMDGKHGLELFEFQFDPELNPDANPGDNYLYMYQIGYKPSYKNPQEDIIWVRKNFRGILKKFVDFLPFTPANERTAELIPVSKICHVHYAEACGDVFEIRGIKNNGRMDDLDMEKIVREFPQTYITKISNFGDYEALAYGLAMIDSLQNNNYRRVETAFEAIQNDLQKSVESISQRFSDHIKNFEDLFEETLEISDMLGKLFNGLRPSVDLESSFTRLKSRLNDYIKVEKSKISSKLLEKAVKILGQIQEEDNFLLNGKNFVKRATPRNDSGQIEPKNVEIDQNFTKKSAMKPDEIGILLAISESDLNKWHSTMGTDKFAKSANFLKDLGKFSKYLCSYLHESNRFRPLGEYEISGKFSKIHMIYMEREIIDQKDFEIDLSTGDLDGYQRLNMTIKDTKNFCTEDCDSICYGTIYISHNLLENGTNMSNSQSIEPIWKNLILESNKGENGSSQEPLVFSIKRLALQFTLEKLRKNESYTCSEYDEYTDVWTECEIGISETDGDVTFQQCLCNNYGYVKTNKVEKLTGPEALIEKENHIINITFFINENYDEVVGTRKTVFERVLSEQIALEIGVGRSQIIGLFVFNGSIGVNFGLGENTDPRVVGRPVRRAARTLENKLKNGNLTLKDLFERPMKIRPQNISISKNMVDQEKLSLVLGSVLAAILGAFALVLGFMSFRKCKKRREDSVRPIKGGLNGFGLGRTFEDTRAGGTTIRSQLGSPQLYNSISFVEPNTTSENSNSAPNSRSSSNTNSALSIISGQVVNTGQGQDELLGQKFGFNDSGVSLVSNFGQNFSGSEISRSSVPPSYYVINRGPYNGPNGPSLGIMGNPEFISQNPTPIEESHLTDLMPFPNAVNQH